MRLSIAQALTHKKRVIESINKCVADINTYNSVIHVPDKSPNRNLVDVVALMNKKDILTKYLIDLKLQLWHVSEKIRKDILEIAEAKSEMNFWNGLNTKHGVHKDDSPYSTQERIDSYDAVYKKSDVDGHTRRVRKLIDEKQAKIESFNYTTMIEVPDIEL